MKKALIAPTILGAISKRGKKGELQQIKPGKEKSFPEIITVNSGRKEGCTQLLGCMDTGVVRHSMVKMLKV